MKLIGKTIVVTLTVLATCFAVWFSISVYQGYQDQRIDAAQEMRIREKQREAADLRASLREYDRIERSKASMAAAIEAERKAMEEFRAKRELEKANSEWESPEWDSPTRLSREIDQSKEERAAADAAWESVQRGALK